MSNEEYQRYLANCELDEEDEEQSDNTSIGELRARLENAYAKIESLEECLQQNRTLILKQDETINKLKEKLGLRSTFTPRTGSLNKPSSVSSTPSYSNKLKEEDASSYLASPPYSISLLNKNDPLRENTNFSNIQTQRAQMIPSDAEWDSYFERIGKHKQVKFKSVPKPHCLKKIVDSIKSDVDTKASNTKYANKNSVSFLVKLYLQGWRARGTLPEDVGAFLENEIAEVFEPKIGGVVRQNANVFHVLQYLYHASKNGSKNERTSGPVDTNDRIAKHCEDNIKALESSETDTAGGIKKVFSWQDNLIAGEAFKKIVNKARVSTRNAVFKSREAFRSRLEAMINKLVAAKSNEDMLLYLGQVLAMLSISSDPEEELYIMRLSAAEVSQIMRKSRRIPKLKFSEYWFQISFDQNYQAFLKLVFQSVLSITGITYYMDAEERDSLSSIIVKACEKLFAGVKDCQNAGKEISRKQDLKTRLKIVKQKMQESSPAGFVELYGFFCACMSAEDTSSNLKKWGQELVIPLFCYLLRLIGDIDDNNDALNSTIITGIAVDCGIMDDGVKFDGEGTLIDIIVFLVLEDIAITNEKTVVSVRKSYFNAAIKLSKMIGTLLSPTGFVNCDSFYQSKSLSFDGADKSMNWASYVKRIGLPVPVASTDLVTSEEVEEVSSTNLVTSEEVEEVKEETQTEEVIIKRRVKENVNQNERLVPTGKRPADAAGQFHLQEPKAKKIKPGEKVIFRKVDGIVRTAIRKPNESILKSILQLEDFVYAEYISNELRNEHPDVLFSGKIISIDQDQDEVVYGVEFDDHTFSTGLRIHQLTLQDIDSCEYLCKPDTLDMKLEMAGELNVKRLRTINSKKKALQKVLYGDDETYFSPEAGKTGGSARDILDVILADECNDENVPDQVVEANNRANSSRKRMKNPRYKEFDVTTV